MVLVVCCALPWNIGLLWLLSRSKQLRAQRCAVLLVNGMCTDLLVAAVFGFVHITLLSTGRWPGRWACALSGIVGVCGSQVSIATLMLLAVERYRAVVLRDVISESFLYRALAVTWASSLLTSTAPLWGFGEYAMQPSGLMCNIPWWSHEPMVFGLTLIVVVVNLSVPLCVIQYCYYRIFRHVKANTWKAHAPLPLAPAAASYRPAASHTAADRERGAAQPDPPGAGAGAGAGALTVAVVRSPPSPAGPKTLPVPGSASPVVTAWGASGGPNATAAAAAAGALPPSPSPTGVSKAQSIEAVVARKTALLTVTFAMCWTPYMAQMLWDVGSGAPADADYDVFALAFVTLNGAINPLIHLYVHEPLRDALLDTLCCRAAPHAVRACCATSVSRRGSVKPSHTTPSPHS